MIAVMPAISRTFSTELEPHFCIEAERRPKLSAAGHHLLVARPVEEHRQLCQLAAMIADSHREPLKIFGRELKVHVRFEECELFSITESFGFGEAEAIQ